MWNLQNFQKMHGCAGPLLVVPSSNGMHSKKCTGIGFLLLGVEFEATLPDQEKLIGKFNGMLILDKMLSVRWIKTSNVQLRK